MKTLRQVPLSLCGPVLTMFMLGFLILIGTNSVQAIPTTITSPAGNGEYSFSPTCDSNLEVTIFLNPQNDKRKVCGVKETSKDGKMTANAYLGIPYAATTGGENRWQPPQSRPGDYDTAWGTSNYLNAFQFGPSCPQGTTEYTMSEDCLSVNVWTPANMQPGESLPVMVFIYGGAFVFGTSATPFYDSTYLAGSEKVVVVTLNYRLGALGFLAYQEGDANFQGNFGILDQRMALDWVQANIEQFGGDPKQVTVFGESAGAMSVGLHMFSSPNSKGLFHAAIMESNPAGILYPDLSLAQTNGTLFVNEICKQQNPPPSPCPPTEPLTWLNGFSYQEIVEMQDDWVFGNLINLLSQESLQIDEVLPWVPNIDGQEIISQPLNGFAPGTSPISFIFGTNGAEGNLFTPSSAGNVESDAKEDAKVDALFNDLYGDQLDSIREHQCFGNRGECYAALGQTPNPGKNNLRPTLGTSMQVELDSDGVSFAHWATDFIFTCANHTMATNALQAGVNAYGYQFTQQTTFNMWPTEGSCNEDPCHGFEMPYVFHTQDLVQCSIAAQAGIVNACSGQVNVDTWVPNSDELGLASAMNNYWVEFAVSQFKNDTTWPKYDGNNPQYMQFKAGPLSIATTVTDFANCVFLDQNPPKNW